MRVVVEPTWSCYHEKWFLSKFEIDKHGRLPMNGKFEDVCEIVGIDH